MDTSPAYNLVLKKIKYLLIFILFFVLSEKCFSQWQQVKSQNGGSVNNICVSKDTVYALVREKGLMKSIDGGLNCRMIYEYKMRLEKLSVENNQILIGAQTAYSSDYGKTFYKLNAPVGAWYNGVVIGGNIILCGDSVFLSKDNGTTFTKPLNHSGWFNIRKSEQKVFVWDYGTNLSFVSIDSGKTWQPFSNGTQKLNEIFDTKGDTVVVLKLNKIEYSTDFGLTWHSNPAPGFAIYPHATLFFKGDTLILATNDSVFYSLNLGINWIPVTGNPDLFPNNINELKGKLLISSLQLGVLELDIDNKSLTDRSNGIHGTQFDAIATNGDTIVAVAKKVLLYYSHDNGHSWHSYHLPNSVGKLFACGQEFYFTQGNWIYKSNDGAVSFNYFTKNKGSGVINDMTFNDSVLYCATNYGIYSVSRTSGFSKKLNSTFSTQVTLFDTLLFVSDGKKIFEMRINDSLLIEVSPPVNMSHAEWNSLTSNDAAIFISSFDKGVYRNYPPDTNWIYTGLYNMGANKIICDKKGNAYCISHKGVMVLLNKPQAKWDPVNHGFPRPLSVYKGDLSINTSSIIFAGSEFPLTGLWSRPLNQIIPFEIISRSNPLTIFPNPTNSELTLYFTDQQKVNGYYLDCYDVTGRVIFSQKKNTLHGNSITINVGMLANGLYFLSVRTDIKSYTATFEKFEQK